MKSGIRRPTLIGIAALHVVILLMIYGLSFYQPEDNTTESIEVIELADIPVPPEPTPAPPVEPVPEPRPQPRDENPLPAPQPTPIPEPTPLPDPTPAPNPPPRPEPPPEPAPPAPEPRPQPQVEVDLSRTVKKTAPETSSPPNPSAILNQLSETVETINRRAATNDEIAAYRALIKRVLYASWTRPPASGEKLEAKVQVRVAPDGSLSLVGLQESSGHSPFDESALAAVRSVSRIPQPLPEGMGNPDYDVPIIFASQD